MSQRISSGPAAYSTATRPNIEMQPILLVRIRPIPVQTGGVHIARELGINDLAGMCAVVLMLTSTDFYKSMTTHADHRIWQDVYHAKTANGDEVYLKLTVIDDVLIVSFKEL